MDNKKYVLLVRPIHICHIWTHLQHNENPNQMMVAAWLIIDHTKVVESSSRMPSHIDTEGGRVYKFFFKAAHTRSLIHRVMLYICIGFVTKWWNRTGYWLVLTKSRSIIWFETKLWKVNENFKTFGLKKCCFFLSAIGVLCIEKDFHEWIIYCGINAQ